MMVDLKWEGEGRGTSLVPLHPEKIIPPKRISHFTEEKFENATIIYFHGCSVTWIGTGR
jgi:hypothetical protein